MVTAIAWKAIVRKHAQVRILSPPQIVKRQRCARRGGGRGERIKASQRNKFEAAAR